MFSGIIKFSLVSFLCPCARPGRAAAGLLRAVVVEKARAQFCVDRAVVWTSPQKMRALQFFMILPVDVISPGF